MLILPFPYWVSDSDLQQAAVALTPGEDTGYRREIAGPDFLARLAEQS